MCSASPSAHTSATDFWSLAWPTTLRARRVLTTLLTLQKGNSNAQCKSRAASFESEPAVVAAILQAIVVNHWKLMR